MSDLQETLNVLAEAELWDDLFNQITGPTAQPAMPEVYFRLKRSLVEEVTPQRHRGRKKSKGMVQAERMARDLLREHPTMSQSEAIERAIDASYPTDNPIKKASKRNTLKRTLSPSGRRR